MFEMNKEGYNEAMKYLRDSGYTQQQIWQMNGEELVNIAKWQRSKDDGNCQEETRL